MATPPFKTLFTPPSLLPQQIMEQQDYKMLLQRARVIDEIESTMPRWGQGCRRSNGPVSLPVQLASRSAKDLPASPGGCQRCRLACRLSSSTQATRP